MGPKAASHDFIVIGPSLRGLANRGASHTERLEEDTEK